MSIPRKSAPRPVRRWLKFNAVGAMGICVQLLAVYFFSSVLEINSLWATALAVEAAVLHNFYGTSISPGAIAALARLGIPFAGCSASMQQPARFPSPAIYFLFRWSCMNFMRRYSSQIYSPSRPARSSILSSATK